MLLHVERLRGRNLRAWYLDGEVTPTIIEDFFPYFKARLTETSALDAIKTLEGVRAVEPFLKDEGIWRVVVEEPSNTPKVSRAAKDISGVEEVYENDIVFLQRFCYDRVDDLFAGNAFEDLCVLAFDIETQFEHNRIPEATHHAVTHIALRWSNREGKVDSVLLHGEEREMLARFCATIRKVDPDIIVTYNGDQFDMPFLMERCERLDVSFDIARAGLKSRIARGRMCGRLREARNLVVVPGRIHVDLYVLVKRNPRLALLLENFSLDEVARVLNIRKVHSASVWDEEDLDPTVVGEKCIEDTDVTLQLADRLVPQEVELAKVVNLPLDITYRSGNSHLIEGLMIREYTAEHVVPNRRGKVGVLELADDRGRDRFLVNRNLKNVSTVPIDLEGYTTDVDVLSKLPSDVLKDLLEEVEPVLREFAEVTIIDRYKANKSKGWLKGRRYALVLSYEQLPFDELEQLHLINWGRPAQSMYPFIMLVFGIRPRSDTLDAYLPLLERLTRWRLEIKEDMKAEQADRAALDARQMALKGLINSFYGYMAFAFSRWRDYTKAAVITAKGREIIQDAMAYLEERECTVIEVDTDGIYFSGRETREEYEELLKGLNTRMPGENDVAITLELEQIIQRGIFYKTKNYALLVDGTLVMKGSSFKSKKLPPIIRSSIEAYTLALLRTGDRDTARETVAEVKERLAAGRVEPPEVAIKERLLKPPGSYPPGQYPHAEAAKLLEQEFGQSTGPGFHVRYFVAKGIEKAVAPRARPLELFDPMQVDAGYYLEKLNDRLGLIEEMAFPRPKQVQSTLFGY
jgi:DNA polymerase elongation subunit (family B)